MTIDRVVGATCFVLAAAAITAGVTLSASTDPPGGDTLGPVDDPATTREFLALYNRAARGTWELDAEFERRQDGEVTLDSDWREVQQGAANQLIAAFGGLTGSFEGRIIECGVFGDETLCDAGAAPDPRARLDRARELASDLVAPRSGDYTLARAPARTVAGEHAECFALHRRSDRATDAFGEESRFCFSDEAIPLLVVQRRGAVVDTRTAVSASTDVDRQDFLELLTSQAAAAERSRVRSEP